MKVCSKCGMPKEKSEFSERSASLDGRKSSCKECAAGYARKRYAANPEVGRASTKRWREKNPKTKLQHRADDLKYGYGLSMEGWDKLFTSQSGKCKICGGDMVKVCVDHDHVTGKIRGLLCTKCNFGLGHFDDSPRRLIAAARYLKLALYLK